MSRRQSRAFQFQPFSRKQKKLLTWWTPKSPYADYDGIICDGSIRSGKTVAMIISFLQWAIHTFPDGGEFILAGRTMGALKRNVLNPMFQILTALGFDYNYVATTDEPRIEIGMCIFYLFGADNEKAQDKIQGLTACGAYLDEAALFPESFVTQAVGRCSVEFSKIWMNCNPAGPFHFIKTNYVDKAGELKILHLHFTLDDNLSLSNSIREKYKRMFSGVFYKRMILGMWVMAEGIVYDMFDADTMIVDKLPNMRKYWIASDYGTSNATTFILCGFGDDERLYVIDEYYHSGRESSKNGGKQKSPSKYAEDFITWLKKNDVRPEWIWIDPSAEGFILELFSRKKEHPSLNKIAQADNAVKRGIELVSSIMENDLFRVHRNCKHVLKEISAYSWDPKAQQRGEDVPIKQNDHTLDPIRYIANGTRLIWQKKGVTRNAVA